MAFPNDTLRGPQGIWIEHNLLTPLPVDTIVRSTVDGQLYVSTSAGPAPAYVQLTGLLATNHNLLLNLLWTVSGHTGAAGALPAFDGAGAAAEVNGAQGAVLFRGAAAWSALAAGVAGQLLTSAGPAADPTWTTPGARSSVLFWGANSEAATTTTRYLFPGFANATASTTVVQLDCPFDGTLDRLFVRHNNPAGNGNLIDYTVRVNGVPTALAVSMASTAALGTDLVNSVAVVQGDRIGIEVTKALGIGASPSDIVASARLRAA